MSIQAVDITAKNGMVTSTQPLASAAGLEMLQKGGNAIDAAVATALALCVVQPSSNGIAGYGGAMVIYLSKEKQTVSLDFNCRAPKAARPDMYELSDDTVTDSGSDLPSVAGKTNFFGPMAVSVPGTIAGLYLAEKTYGKLGWEKVVEPALRLARDGFEVYPALPANIRGFADNTDDISRRAILPDERVPGEGEIWVQFDLAKLFETLASDPDSFYRGKIAKKIVERVQFAGGILTEDDMASFEVEFTEPMKMDYHGVTIHATTGVTGVPTSFQVLAIMQKLNSKKWSADDPGYWGCLTDALTLAWIDRLSTLGDVPGIEEKINKLFSDEYATSQAELVRNGKVPINKGDVENKKETIHLNTCDSERNMVSLTQTHGGGWGTRFGIPGLGIVIGHGMSRFDPRPDHPNSPGSWKRPLHNMSPFIMTIGNEPLGCLGLPGGRNIPSVMPQFAINLLDFGLTPAQTIDYPRIHTETGLVRVQPNLMDFAKEAIKKRGYELWELDYIGGALSVIMRQGDSIIGSAQSGQGGPNEAVGF